MLTEDSAEFINADFLEEVTYTPNGGSPATIDAIVNDDYPNQEAHPETGLRFAVADLIVKASDITTPDHRDRFTFHGYTWDVAVDGYQKSNIFLTVNLERSL